MDGNFHCGLCNGHGCNDNDLPGAIQVTCRRRIATIARICDKCAEALADAMEAFPERFLAVVESLRIRTDRTVEKDVGKGGTDEPLSQHTPLPPINYSSVRAGRIHRVGKPEGWM